MQQQPDNNKAQKTFLLTSFLLRELLNKTFWQIVSCGPPVMKFLGTDLNK